MPRNLLITQTKLSLRRQVIFRLVTQLGGFMLVAIGCGDKSQKKPPQLPSEPVDPTSEKKPPSTPPVIPQQPETGAASTQQTEAMPPFEPRLDISQDDQFRYFRANGIPNHSVGRFPNVNDPFRIKEQEITVKVPLYPKREDTLGGQIDREKKHVLGIAINGVLFHPSGPWFEGDGSSGLQFEPNSDLARLHLGLDHNNAHVQTGGLYHYHGLPHGLLIALNPAATAKMVLLGYMADGFPLYNNMGPKDPSQLDFAVAKLQSSYRLRQGSRPASPGGKYDGIFVQDYVYEAGAGDLDEYNGREGPTPEFPNGTYYYVATENFPFLPLTFRGTPDPSFLRTKLLNEFPDTGNGSGPGLPAALKKYKGQDF